MLSKTTGSVTTTCADVAKKWYEDLYFGAIEKQEDRIIDALQNVSIGMHSEKGNPVFNLAFEGNEKALLFLYDCVEKHSPGSRMVFLKKLRVGLFQGKHLLLLEKMIRFAKDNSKSNIEFMLLSSWYKKCLAPVEVKKEEASTQAKTPKQKISNDIRLLAFNGLLDEAMPSITTLKKLFTMAHYCGFGGHIEMGKTLYCTQESPELKRIVADGLIVGFAQLGELTQALRIVDGTLGDAKTKLESLNKILLCYELFPMRHMGDFFQIHSYAQDIVTENQQDRILSDSLLSKLFAVMSECYKKEVLNTSSLMLFLNSYPDYQQKWNFLRKHINPSEKKTNYNLLISKADNILRIINILPKEQPYFLKFKWAEAWTNQKVNLWVLSISLALAENTNLDFDLLFHISTFLIGLASEEILPFSKFFVERCRPAKLSFFPGAVKKEEKLSVNEDPSRKRKLG